MKNRPIMKNRLIMKNRTMLRYPTYQVLTANRCAVSAIRACYQKPTRFNCDNIRLATGILDINQQTKNFTLRKFAPLIPQISKLP